MNASAQAIQASYAACRRLSRQAGSNFPVAFLLLPRAKRRAMDALYAFMRHSDDLMDTPNPGHMREHSLLQWRAALEHALLGCLESSGERHDDDLGRAILPAVAHMVEQFHVPAEYLRAALDGVEMDLHQRRYQNFGELQTYCERVASAVGLACIHIWGFDGEEALAPARSAGLALQLTNILRDLKEDVEQDRVYLPLEDMAECGYTVEELRDGAVNPAFHRLMGLEIGRAEEFYRQGTELFRRLQPDGQRIFGAMLATYRALLAEIKQRPGDVFARRIRLSWPRKLGIVARWAFFAPRSIGSA